MSSFKLYPKEFFFVLKPVKLSQNDFLKPSAKHVTRKLGENIEKLIKTYQNATLSEKGFYLQSYALKTI